MGNEIWRRSALQLASDIKSGRTTSREVVQAHLDRIGSTLAAIFVRAEAEGRPTGAVADAMAEAIFRR